MDIEEHRAIGGVRAELDVAPLFGANRGAVNGAAVFAPDAESGLSPTGAWVVEERHQARAFDGTGDFEFAELGHGAVDVEGLNDACGGAAVAVGSRHVDDQGHTGAIFKERASF